MRPEPNKTKLISITEIIEHYLPVSRRKARRLIHLYLNPKVIGNTLYVDRQELENLLSDPERERFPLNL